MDSGAKSGRLARGWWHRGGASRRRDVQAALLLACALAGCVPADFDALSSEVRGSGAPDACAASAGSTAADGAACAAPEPDDAQACGPCRPGEICRPCEAAAPCTNCSDAAADSATSAVAPSCDAQAGACDAGADVDATVCKDCAGAGSGEAGRGEAGSGEAGAGEAGAGGAPDPTPAGCAAQPRECEPGNVDVDRVPCGACNTGSQQRTRTCDAATCTWSPWSDFGACTGVTAACTPQETTACENGDSCGHRVCTASCTWGACEPIQPTGCLRIRAGHTDMGSNYRCCGVGHWQFCLPDCTWSTQCAACSEGAPNYCTECYGPNSTPDGKGGDGQVSAD